MDNGFNAGSINYTELSRNIGLTMIAPDIDYRGRTVFITGGADGIGRANAKAYHHFGANVIALDVNKEKLASLKTELGGERITVLPFDLRVKSRKFFWGLISWNPFKALTKKIANASNGVVDVYHINAGVIKAAGPDAKNIATTPMSEVDSLYAINVRSHIALYQHLLPMLKESDSGRILLTSSPIVGRTDPASANYAWTKGALELNFATVAKELSETPDAKNIMVTGYVPPPVQNWLRAHWKNEPLYANPMPEDVSEVPLRLGSRSASLDMAGKLIVFLDKRTKGIVPQDGGEKYDANHRTENGFDLGLRIRPIAQGGGTEGAAFIETYDTWYSRQLVGAEPVPPLDENNRLRSNFHPPGWVGEAMRAQNG